MKMKNQIKFKNYTIVRWVTVFENGEPVGEFDSMADAKAYYTNPNGYEFKYAAAEAFFKNGYYLVEDLCGHSAKYKEIQDYSNFYNQCYKGLYKWPEIEITTVDESIGRYVSYEKQ